MAKELLIDSKVAIDVANVLGTGREEIEVIAAQIKFKLASFMAACNVSSSSVVEADVREVDRVATFVLNVLIEFWIFERSFAD